MFQAALSVFRFELRRSLTVGRICIWSALCLFPCLLVATLRVQSRGNIPDEAYAIICYVLVPQVSCMLGLLLWATPAIGAELEAQSWINLAVRPHGRTAVAMGKYAVAVVWTASYGILSSIVVSLLAGVDEMFALMASLCTLVVLSSIAYSALYLLIGATFYRRATVAAVVYSLVLEGLISWIPATINQITVSYRLRTLHSDWTAASVLRDSTEDQGLFGTESSLFNIAVIFCYAAACLAVATYVARTKEYPIQTEA
jgi:ABC-type transport system involved in multi-copper enzyme maturation permease subunit